MEDFDKAIEDTLIALNTGVLRTRDGSILKQADGKSSVQNSLWREKLYTITDMLTAIRRRLKRDYEKLWDEVSKVLRELSELVAK